MKKLTIEKKTNADEICKKIRNIFDSQHHLINSDKNVTQKDKWP